MTPASQTGMIFHIARLSDWNKALEDGSYACESLEHEGFIHFSTGKQLLATANHLYRGQEGLILLVVDPEALAADLQFEPVGVDQVFPHLYGALNLDAVRRVMSFIPADDGIFSWPEALQGHASEL